MGGRLDGRVAIVTGAASGIGRATAQRLAREGARLILADLNRDGLATVQAETGGDIFAFDAGDAQSCRDLVAQAVANAGRIDILANIAGIMDWGPMADFDDDRWERMLRINLSGAWHMCRAAMPHLVQTKGVIVNMSSAAGLVGIPYTTAYCAAKAGVVALTKSLAVEFAAAGVRVNAICPTGVKTAMHGAVALPDGVDMDLVMRNSPKLGDLCDPEDIAAAVAFLASDDARKITGIAMPVDAGQTAG
ncbi:NAD(P)-dependent dehydrogenase, short-chain alcohol dehydrogenase family [Sphingomonas laterariae]|uniref:NAD(P)-dependent dehydrogenase, short-chain alcohol dehydrogenase family n=1 Tax=Edaphosphingomonas laterariae TaxID=861865 RepID=A0A239CZK8_9SPHN|nr:SDR family oxidoreductase [Sphingomonas laterariae]SNS25706.1 NAD(P)-dependent dehydrogenase, short-chain alcohol dehydrogenase family [Sphingomonas laterariae]